MIKTKLILIMFLALIYLGCARATPQPDKFAELDKTYVSNSIYEALLESILLHEFMLQDAASPQDLVSQYACIRVLMDDYEKAKPMLIDVMNDRGHFIGDTNDIKDIAAYIILRKQDKSAYPILARYYISRMKDPEYHTYDFLSTVRSHRHGGFICYKNDSGEKFMIQFCCPMDELLEIGKPAVPFLLPLLRSGDRRLRGISIYLIREITKLKLDYNVFTSDDSDASMVLKKLGWIDE